MSKKAIQIPRVVWTLGDPEQTTTSGVTIVRRPLYYRPDAAERAVRVGSLDPDYAAQVLDALMGRRDA